MKRLLPLRVLLPLALGMVVSLAILGFAEFGYQRLEFANRAMSTALEMETVVNETLALIVDAESSQRGYLLTGDPSYLKPYQAALPKIDKASAHLRDLVSQNGTTSMIEHSSHLATLIGEKLNDLESTLTLNDRNGREAALQLIDTGVGQKLMEQIHGEAQSILDELRLSAQRGGLRWARDIEFGRVGMLTMTAFTIALLFVVMALSRREIAAREAKRRMLVEEQHRLEREVAARTEELSELSTYLQTVREEEKSRLARDIHDELGGILVGAKMDVAWASQRCKASLPDAANKLERALTILDEGVEMKRRIIEELRPTLLDNLGLAPALEWQVRQTCERAGLDCDLNLGEPSLPPDVSIALYRIVQEALTNIVKYANARHVDIDLGRGDDGISLVIEDDGRGLPAGAATDRLSHGIIGMRQRVRAFNGDFRISSRAGAGTRIEVFIPLAADGTAPQDEPDADARGRASAASAAD
ncbi:MAG: CHASE3 domain-containing protein [Betaproteobacteria bacterium]|nr:CHASE3 domain-containing protein [Betaproteobacteria bacterium]MDE2003901.1 CHASE3 domain-containing protein [Betaproteobacteria bacterium]MDE2209044.1 CHASE3 domain-containing protein [Betaproteobacteria bacterium]MDE2360165.1 CHASE3 domain-containing protein [Betaproteobacteria bacterium]